jgi:branched-chain amino acid aminotransferase
LDIYVDGRFVAREDARVSVFDHGFLYGDGVFEGIRAYGGRIFRLKEHIDRLYQSARAIMLEIPLPPAEMAEVVRESCARNDIRDGYIRLIVSRGEGDLGLDPRKCPRPTVVCIADRIALFPPETYEKGIAVGAVSTRRTPTESLNARIKSLNYLNSILAKIESNLAGHAEALMMTQEGYVAEGPGENIFIVRGGRLLTPAPHLGILEGITRAAIMDLARGRGVPVAETVFTRHDVWTADEAFFCGTACEVMPITSCDGRRIGDGRPGPITRQLSLDFRALVAREGVPITAPAHADADGQA